MVKLYSIALLRQDGFATGKPTATVLGQASDLSEFGFFSRGSVAEFMTFFSKTIAARTNPSQRQAVEEQNYLGHVYAHSRGVCGVIISDKDYPSRVAFSLINKVIDEFLSRVPAAKWSSDSIKQDVAGECSSYPELARYLSKYQDPKQADTILKVQQDLDDTRVVLHKTIESVLARGEKLDTLVERSDQLSAQSKLFYKQAKKTNSCCVIS